MVGRFPIVRKAGWVWLFLRLFRRSCIAFYKDNGFGIAKAAAYSAFLSFFPLLTTVAMLLFRANANSIARSLSGLLYQAVPPGAEQFVLYNLLVERGQKPGSLIATAVMVSLWAGSGLMMSLMEGFQKAYNVPNRRGLVEQRAVAIVLVVAAGLPVVLASALVVFGERIEALLLQRLGYYAPTMGVQGWVELAGLLSRYAIATGAIVFATSLLYHLGPQRPRRWRRVLPGALLAAFLFIVVTIAFGWYVRNIAHYNVFYGSLSAVIALLVWMYLLSLIALLGCEFNAARERLDVVMQLPAYHPKQPADGNLRPAAGLRS